MRASVRRQSGVRHRLLPVLLLLPLSLFFGATGPCAPTDNGTPPPGGPPAAPAGVSATAGDGQVIVRWDPVNGAASYNLYMASVSGVSRANYGSLPDGMARTDVTSPHVQTGLTNDQTYYLVVTAVNADGESAESAPASGTPRAGSATGTTWFVSPDGGSLDQCTGLADAPYPGAGTGQPCAWDHPFRALPPGGPPNIAGGDTLIIGSGNYRMGYGAPGAEVCAAEGTWDCYMTPIPSGPDAAHPTRILGAGWDAGSPAPPELWGAERANWILNLTDASNIEVGWLEVTDHSDCVEFHSGSLPCQRDTPPYGDWAVVGLYAEDSANVHLHDLNIHGLAGRGVLAGRLTDWTVENVRIAANGMAGWDGDIEGDDSNSGTMLFRHWTVEWNGCGETWPEGQPTGCWAQEAGGYGDGVGTGFTQGHWVIEDSAFLYNTSDGLDLLYTQAGSLVEVRGTRAEGNAGNQLKTSGPASVENSIVVGNCGFFEGKSFTFNVDNCRAVGTALFFNLRRGDRVSVTNCTVASEGDCLLTPECNDLNCDGSESVVLRNNIFVGHTDFLQPFENTCFVYQETFPSDPFDIDYTIVTDTKDTPPCPGLHDLCGVSSGVVSASIDSFDAHLLADSPAINAGTPTGAPTDDFSGRPRDGQPDIGAFEYTATP